MPHNALFHRSATDTVIPAGIDRLVPGQIMEKGRGITSLADLPSYGANNCFLYLTPTCDGKLNPLLTALT